MMSYVDVCAVTDISNGKHRAFDVSGRSILIFQLNGDLFAIENRCTHLDFPLEGGRQIGCEIICPAHGARFDVRTGKALCGPAVDPVARIDIRKNGVRIEVRVDHADVADVRLRH